MTEFRFDPVPSPGTNRASTKPCPTCDGHRLIQIDVSAGEVYDRCPDCNPRPASERKPVPVEAWWKE